MLIFYTISEIPFYIISALRQIIEILKNFILYFLHNNINVDKVVENSPFLPLMSIEIYLIRKELL